MWVRTRIWSRNGLRTGLRGEFCVRAAPFFEPDPLERVSGPSSAGNRPKTKHKLYLLFHIISKGKMCRGSVGSPRPPRGIGESHDAKDAGFHRLLIQDRPIGLQGALALAPLPPTHPPTTTVRSGRDRLPGRVGPAVWAGRIIYCRSVGSFSFLFPLGGSLLDPLV